MNALLKALLKEAADLFVLGEEVLQKKSIFEIFPSLVKAGTDAALIPALLPDLQNELNALLTNPAADADLLAYANSLVTGDAKAHAIISASAKLVLDLVTDVGGLLAAFKK